MGSGSPACQQATRRPALSVSSGGSSRAAAVGRERAAGGVRTPGRHVGGVDRPARDHRERLVEVGVHVGHRGDERPGVGVPGGAGEVGGGQVLDDLAGVHDEHPVADLPDDGDVVADQHQRDVVGGPDRGEQVEHLLLHGHVQGGGRLVGHDQRGRAHQAHPDHRALPHAARELVRVLVRPVLRVGDPDRAHPVDRAGQRGPAVHPLVVAGDLGELAAHPLRRVERRHRVLEHHRQRGAEQLALRLAVGRPEVVAEELEPGRVDAAGVADQPADGERGQRLAGARLPHDADRLATAYGEGDAADRTDRPGGAGEGDLEVADVEHDVVGVVVGDVDRRGRLHRRRGRRQLDPGDDADAEDLGDGLAEQVEGESGDDHGDAGRERGGRVDVDRADAVEEQPTPVVRRLLHAEAEERQAGEGQQRAARADGGVDDQRLGDVREHVPEEDPHPADAGDAGGVDEVARRDRRDQGPGETAHRRGAGEPDREAPRRWRRRRR